MSVNIVYMKAFLYGLQHNDHNLCGEVASLIGDNAYLSMLEILKESKCIRLIHLHKLGKLDIDVYFLKTW